MRLDIIEFRRETINRPITEEVDVATEVPVKIAVKDPETGELNVQTVMEMRIGKKQVTRLIQEDKDYVEFAAPGRKGYATAVKTMGEIRCIHDAPLGEDDDDKIAEAQKRDLILEAYEAWKLGHALPEHGIPLGAWPAVTAKVADQLRMAGVRSVEDVAELTEQAKSRLGHIGNLGDLIKQAKLFLGSADKLATATQMKSLEDRNTAQAEQLAEQEAMLREMQAMLIELKQQAPGASDKPKRAKAEVAA